MTWRISAYGELHGEFQPGWPGWKKNAITWEISARAETECEGGNRCFLYLLLYTRVLHMHLWILSPGWNFLSITRGISARSTGLKISSRVAQTGLKFQPGSPGWNFLHVIANSVLQGFYRKPAMNFQPGQPGWKFIPGWKSPCNQPLTNVSEREYEVARSVAKLAYAVYDF